MRTCEVEGCARKHQARGYCSKHYNEIVAGPDRHKVTRHCNECDTEYTTTRSNGKYCSIKCRDTVLHREKRGTFRERPPKPVVIKQVRDNRSPLRRAYEDQDWAGILEEVRRECQLTPDGCWEWQRRLDQNGYPNAKLGRKYVAIHRLVIEAKYEAPLGKQAAHHMCANRKCCNPKHLQPITHYDNSAEMLARHSYLARIAELESELDRLDPQNPLLYQIKVA